MTNSILDNVSFPAQKEIEVAVQNTPGLYASNTLGNGHTFLHEAIHAARHLAISPVASMSMLKSTAKARLSAAGRSSSRRSVASPLRRSLH